MGSDLVSGKFRGPCLLEDVYLREFNDERGWSCISLSEFFNWKKEHMRETIKLLTNGDSSVAAKFKLAKAHWQELLIDIDTVGVQTLADRLTNEQGWFEDKFGNNRHEGQEAIAWVGFSLLLEEDEDYIVLTKRGAKLLEAFRLSDCSGELKVDAISAARYHFIEND